MMKMNRNWVNDPASTNGMKRKRGGQLGNNNARKHGFYSESFKFLENELLSSSESENFEDEIKLIRVIIKRTMDKIAEENNLTLEENLSVMRTVSFAAAVLERLRRSKHLAFNPQNRIGDVE
ncbi:MAG: hypothetical protein IH589_04345 [Anaerolineales bacterium]|nr:hypothetical protein [Anaerolineales bacterium]